MQNPQDYSVENDARRAVVAALDEFGYRVSGYSLSDSDGKDGEIRTIKLTAARPLGFEQTRFDLSANGGGAQE